MMAQSTYALKNEEDLDNVEDMRIHATMYPNNGTNLYRACVAGIRRQKYWNGEVQIVNYAFEQEFDRYFSVTRSSVHLFKQTFIK